MSTLDTAGLITLSGLRFLPGELTCHTRVYGKRVIPLISGNNGEICFSTYQYEKYRRTGQVLCEKNANFSVGCKMKLQNFWCARLSVDSDFHQVAVGIADVDAVHFTLRAIARHYAADDFCTSAAKLVFYFINVAFRDKTKVKRTGRRVCGGGQEFSRTGVNVYFLLSKVQAVPACVFFVAKLQNLRVKVQALRKVGSRQNKVI